MKTISNVKPTRAAKRKPVRQIGRGRGGVRRSETRQTDAAYPCGRVQASAERHAAGIDSRA